jgi:hypothetical protein
MRSRRHSALRGCASSTFVRCVAARMSYWSGPRLNSRSRPPDSFTFFGATGASLAHRHRRRGALSVFRGVTAAAPLMERSLRRPALRLRRLSPLAPPCLRWPGPHTPQTPADVHKNEQQRTSEAPRQENSHPLPPPTRTPRRPCRRPRLGRRGGERRRARLPPG